MYDETNQSIHPWWVRKSRWFAAFGLGFSVLYGVVLLAVVAKFELGREAVARDAVPDRAPGIGVDHHHPEDPDVARFFEPTDHFHGLASPQPGEWLHEFGEPGQSVEHYFAAAPNPVTTYRKTLYIQPLGRLDERSVNLGILAEYLEIYFGLETHILPPIDPSGEVTTRGGGWQGRRQWHTGDLLDGLAHTSRDDAYATLGVTLTDLYPDDEWAFVFGHARFRERVAVLSMARYRPAEPLSSGDEKLYLERVLKVATHELGHSFGILHCVHWACNMNGVNSLEESDAKPLHLCPVDLEKLQTATGWHPGERYRRLVEFYRRYGMDEAAEWAEERLK